MRGPSDLTKTNNLCIIYVFAGLTRGITLQYVAFILRPTGGSVWLQRRERRPPRRRVRRLPVRLASARVDAARPLKRAASEKPPIRRAKKKVAKRATSKGGAKKAAKA